MSLRDIGCASRGARVARSFGRPIASRFASRKAFNPHGTIARVAMAFADRWSERIVRVARVIRRMLLGISQRGIPDRRATTIGNKIWKYCLA